MAPPTGPRRCAPCPHCWPRVTRGPGRPWEPAPPRRATATPLPIPAFFRSEAQRVTRSGRRAITAAVALVLAGAAHASTSQEDLARERRLASRISRDRALDMVRRLVAEGPRMGGTPSGDRAAGLVAVWLKEAGL